MFCIYCGKEIPDNAEFCSYCGKLQKKSNKSAGSDDENARISDFGDPNILRERSVNSNSGHKGNPLLWLGGIAIVVFIIVFLIKNMSGSSTSVAAPAQYPEYSEAEDTYLPSEEEADDTYAEEYTDDDTEVYAEDDTDEEYENVSHDVVIDWQTIEQVLEDSDGYQIKRTFKISPFIASDNAGALTSAVVELGGDMSDLPTIEYGNLLLRYWKNNEINEAYYVLGEMSLENVTQGYDITPNNPHSVLMYIALAPDEGYVPQQGDLFIGSLGNDDSNLGWEITKVFFTNQEMLKVGHGGYEGYVQIERGDYDPDDTAIYLGHANMESNSWGPIRFVMMFPNKHTPALPDGFEVYNNIKCFVGDVGFKLDILE